MEISTATSSSDAPETPHEACEGSETLETSRLPSDTTPAFATQAFLNGYSVLGDVPLPQRARTAHGASQAALVANPDAPDLSFIESVGVQEGAYAKIYYARDRLGMKYDKKIRRWTKRLSMDVDGAQVVINSKAILGIKESTSPNDALKASVLAMLVGLLTTYSDLVKEGSALAAAAKAEGTALGTAAAALLMAVQAKSKIPDLATLQSQSLATLKAEASYWSGVDKVMHDMLAGLAGDVAQILTPAIASGTPEDQIATQVQSTVGLGDGAAFYLDAHIHAAFALAILSLYQSQRPGKGIDFLSCGDNRVCSECLDAEDGSPYKPSDVPLPPLHGNCRCWISPA